MHMKKKGMLLVLSLLTAFSLTVSAVNGQSINNESNTTQTESQSGTLMDCYSNFYSGMIVWKMFGDNNTDSNVPELKQFFTNICNFVHDETGQWLDIWKSDEFKMIFNQTDMNKFNTKYYPQGIPQSIIDDSGVIVAMAGGVGNGTNTNTEDENTNTEDENTNTEDE
jgi:hypothetical protein